jgi:hypothetical protein
MAVQLRLQYVLSLHKQQQWQQQQPLLPILTSNHLFLIASDMVCV